MNAKLYRLLILSAMMLFTQAFAQQAAPRPLLAKARYFVNNKVTDSAIIYADKALHILDTHNDTLLRAKALGYKGKAYFYQNKYSEAAEYYFSALKLCTTPRTDTLMALMYSEIGYVHYIQSHYKEAKVYYYKGLEVRKRLQQYDEVCNALINISVMCKDHEEYKEAFAALDEVHSLLPVTKDPAITGYYYTNKGAILELTHQNDSAALYYHKAYDTWKALGKESEIYKITFNLGYLAAERKDYKEALRYYHLAEDAVKKFGSRHEIAHVYGTIAEGYAGMGDHKNAYLYLYKYAELSDSLAKEEFNSHVIKLDKQFQTEKNKQTIQDQQLKLQSATLAVQRQRSTTLIIILILIIVAGASVILFSYLTFQRRLNKRVEEAKGRFFENVVHEIRTPLSMIQGPIKVLQTKATDEATRHQLDIAERNTQRLNDLINQMLDISKLDAASYTLNERVGNLEDFIGSLVLQYEAQMGGITFSHQTEIDKGNVIFDRDALEKIIGNLLGNAIKYTPAGGAVGINVSATSQGDHIMLQIVVWDTGMGIAQQEQEKIFERFYRSEEQAHTATKGIGIGLALTKELVELMQGTIELVSAPGQGAVFTIAIPLKKATKTAAGETLTEGKNTILLVEDDADILDFNRLLLAEKGYNVITAANGAIAARIMNETLPDLVITDLMMPEKDGLELLKEIRNNELTSGIPVIILSARTSGQAKIEGISEGAQAYLAKPFIPEELTGLVHNQLQLLEKHKHKYREQVQQEEQSIEDRFAGDDPFTRKCFALILEHLNDAQLSVEKLAELMNVNRSHFQRKVKTLTGYSPSEMIRTIRLEQAKNMLLRKEGNITEIAYSTGFTSQSYFTKCFSEHFGFPPSQLQEHV